MILLGLLLTALTMQGAFTQSFTDDFAFTLPQAITFFGESKTNFYMSFSATNAYICFNGYYHEESHEKDCISFSAVLLKYAFVITVTGSSVDTELKSQIPTIPTPAVAKVIITLIVSGFTYYDINLFSAGLHAGLVIYPQSAVSEVVILVKGKEVTKQTPSTTFPFDLSGCRGQDGAALLLKKEKNLPNCQKETCTTPGKSTTSSTCAATAVCVSESCKSKATCTFTGPSVIDYKGEVGAIQDLCDYFLLGSTFLPDFSVEGKFIERRRKDKSFLNTVVLKYKTTTVFNLKQGGIVTEADKVLTLTDQPTVSGVVTFTKSDEGVTAKYSEKGVDVVVFFNGVTAQIDITGPPSQDLGLKHLCAKAKSTPTDVRATTGSCEKKGTEDKDKTIKCDEVKARCGILMNDPFTSCHQHVEPNPYIKACSDTMCFYPEIDGLTCYFFEAYSRACSLYNPPGVTDWRAKGKCPTAPKALCQGKSCASQEFCGQVGEDGDWECLCRPINIQKYRTDRSLGDATSCGSGSASASLINCLLLEKGIDYTTLQLNEKSCTGELIDGKVVFKFDNSDTCGAEIEDTNGAVNYKNTIQVKDLPAGTILRQDPVDITFSCNFAAPKLQLMSFKVTGSSSVVNKPVEAGKWEYTLTMKAFANEARTEDLKSVELGQRVWIELKATGVDSKMSAVLFDSCWATTKKEPESEPKYYLVSKGCKNPKDSSVQLTGNGAGILSVFSFTAFKFPKSDSEVYLHCKVSMCGIKKDKTCVPDCTKITRRRRFASSLQGEDNSSLITMAWGL